MSGMEPMLLGAALGGGISAARGGNPITGALLGGMGGAVFGGASGLASSKLAAAAPTGTGALAGAGKSGMFTAGTQVPNAMGASGTYFSSGMPAASAGNAFMPEGAIAASTPAMSAPTFMQTVKEIPNSFGAFSRENPLMTNVGGQMLRDELNPQPMAAATQPGLLRGNPIPLEQQQFASMPPRQPISLI